MINFTKKTNYLNFEEEFSLATILRSVISKNYSEDCQMTGVYVHNRYGKSSSIKISCETGSAALTTSTLLHYPALIQQLRQVKHCPTYTLKIIIDDIQGAHKTGLKETIQAFQTLDGALAVHRKEKALIDAKINNLIMLYGQEKTTPIYNGSKPYYIKNYTSQYREHCRLVFISGIKYLYPRLPRIYAARYGEQAKIYQLYAHDLLKEHLEKNKIGYKKYIDDRFFYVRGLVGGMINTPILIFRCAQSNYHRGKYYYLDLNQNKLIPTLTEARRIAETYAGKNYKIDIWEKKK